MWWVGIGVGAFLPLSLAYKRKTFNQKKSNNNINYLLFKSMDEKKHYKELNYCYIFFIIIFLLRVGAGLDLSLGPYIK